MAVATSIDTPNTDTWQMPSTLMTLGRVTLWILGLWAWGTLLNQTPSAVDYGILGVSLLFAVPFFWHYPVYGIITLMFFASGFLPPDFVDVRLPIGGGFEMRDITLLLMLGLLLFKGLATGRLHLPLPAISLPLIAFFVLVVMSLINALFFENVASNWALSDARILSFYLIFFIVGWGVRDEQALIKVLIGSFIIADITAAIVLLQQQLGASSYVLPSMSDGSWEVWLYEGSVRVVPPSIVYLYFMNLMSIGLAVFINRGLLTKIFLIGHALFLSTALLFTFTRSAWVASVIAILLMIPLLAFVYRRYIPHALILGGALLMFIGGTLGLIIDTPSVENEALSSVGDRIVSIFTVEDTMNSNSIQWRLYESQEATKAIQEHPLTGVGLGNTYRSLTSFQGEAEGLWTDEFISYDRIDRFQRYVHTSYLALTVKMGIPALVMFLLFCAASLLSGLILYFQTNNNLARALSLMVVVGMIGLLQWSILHAHLMLAGSTATIGLMIGLLASINYIYPRHYAPVSATEKMSLRDNVKRLITAFEQKKRGD